jgi:hypothetical protein
MASDSERERMLAGFRQAQQIKEDADVRARRPRLPIPSVVLAGIVAVVVVGAIVAIFAVPIFISFQMTEPVRTFCRDIGAQNYASAYGDLSSALKSRLPEDQFAQRVQQAQFSSCQTISSAQLGASGNTGHIVIEMLFGNNQNTRTEQATFLLVDESDGWRIDSIRDAILPLP